MSYRRVEVEGESFWVRTTDAAVTEWAEQRDRLRLEGNPDRPPDIDTPTSRAWVRHPGESHPYFDRHAIAQHGSFFPVVTMVWSSGDQATRLYVTGFADGGFTIDVMTAGGPKRHQTFGGQVDPEVVNESLEVAMAIVGTAYTEPPLVNWPWDFDELDGLVAEAEEDVRKWSMN